MDNLPTNMMGDMMGVVSLAPEKTMRIVLDALHELVDYELAVVMSYDGADTLRVHSAVGPLATHRLDGFSLSLDKRPDLKELLHLGVPHLFDEEKEHVDTYEALLDLPDEHSCMVAPLELDGQTVGMMTLDNRRCGAFSSDIIGFIHVISRLIAVALTQSENARFLRESNARLLAERNRLLEKDADAFAHFIGSSVKWEAVKEHIKLVAATDSSVLLLGETGTGKEEAARAIHKLSAYAGGPFVAVNCSALPASLAESELFGHEKGAFTGAQAMRKGRFELADGGTLFLDEIGELPMELQPKLLRALQEGCFERVGGEHTVRVNVRIIAATHVDLAAAVSKGNFREDLYYRISVFPITLPALRERGNDVIILAEYFASQMRHRSGWGGLYFTHDALHALLARPWKGNVRELRNTMERAAILARGGELTAEMITGSGVSSPPVLNFPSGGEGFMSLMDMERNYISHVLSLCAGRVYGEKGAAVKLGLKPSTLQSRMKKLGLT
ncbi:sigma-54-dependent Fis family transcriptional regulator [Parasphaerochaeta coccoides]|uniref:Transcriptional regulator, NifA subfamily, Fis Family n=1 Tax=Parasphaerochaeta coccoides (strain ATCC BAA-1237 / DSM 17374 / SPN1) TaxID=760011 RepID=F4GKQ8_PARC1|nr:sigma 54-interacting transcriptional regulator [Parasphaerochaeta coccoides]AEC01467.1 transcriptional regulator, NifA subfamily, Fis Family [Parasphaerochaeta coccoides DSM 17374]